MLRLVLNLALIACVYGRARIAEGDDAKIENFNYHVSLRILDIHTCGGSLLKPDVVVTAAHCVYGYTSRYFTVKAGSNNALQGGVVHKVESINIHEHYAHSTKDYDVAILKLALPFELSDKVGTIKLIPSDYGFEIGEIAVVTGWGATTEGGRYSDVLQSVKLPLVSWNLCQEKYAGKDLTSRMICWGYLQGGKGICQGDYGSPLVIYGKVNKHPLLASIASWGIGCGRRDQPGVFVDVRYPEIHNFITQYL